jgi:hypothetical protein
VSEAVGETVDAGTPLEHVVALADRHGVRLQEGWDAGEVVLELYEKLVEHTLLQPTFVRDYPVSARPLARNHRDDPRLAEAWDLVVAGTELATGYSELVDPVEQRRRLTEQSVKAAGGDPEAMQLDEDFLRALEHGAPPMGGQGHGHRPAGHAAHRRADPRDDPVPARAAHQLDLSIPARTAREERMTHAPHEADLRNWRSFKNLDVALGQRLVVIGPNASGKSNLLDAVRFLRDLARPGGGLQDAIQRRGSLSRVRCLFARNNNKATSRSVSAWVTGTTPTPGRTGVVPR